MLIPTFDRFKKMANALRILAMDAVEAAQSGHPGLPMGMADVVTVLFSDFLVFNPQDPTWFNRDRFILSAGHGSMLLYALGHLTGYEQMTLDQLKNFRRLGSLTPGHPEYHPEIGVETTTGPLAQGLGNAVGMALAEAILNSRFGDTLVDHYTYVLASDGCLMEGLSQEAISLAGHLRLGKLIVLFDDNKITIDGPTDLSTSDHPLERFKASGWHVQSIDGHNPQEIFEALQNAQEEGRPSLIACRTIIGYGAPHKAGTAAAHGAPLGREEILGARGAFQWSLQPFEVPADILQSWRLLSERNIPTYTQWQKAYKSSQDHTFRRLVKGKLPENWKLDIYELIKAFTQTTPTQSTRQTSGQIVGSLVNVVPELIGGSADLTPSNFTKSKASQVINAQDYNGNYIHYGIREHAMAAAMNGLALHGGVRPYGGTFLVFSDYCRPAIRLSALMNLPVIYVMTHDSIGVGEDGPTHQPIEHLASLRAIPNLNVFRPADAIEVAECWITALEMTKMPSLLALSRQSVPTLRHEYMFGENLSAYGGYVLRGEQPKQTPFICLIATGSEVSLTLEVQKILETKNMGCRVVSMPCRCLFDQQSDDYQAKTLGPAPYRFVIEAASPFGWEKYTGKSDHIFGISTFGASGPYEDIYAHFGLTSTAIAERIQKLINVKEEVKNEKTHRY